MSDSPHPPSAIRHYRIERKLGSGGMGEVYLASDTQLRRQVAIKFLMPLSEGGADLQQRMLREARAAAVLDHANICPVFEVGEHNHRPFIVMQYVEGETLASRLGAGRLEPGVALAIASQIAEALHAAHSTGIIHRDIKPQNIIITPSGQVKLLDFGVAKVTKVLSPEDETSATVDGAVVSGQIIGTPAYMSPEQARGGNVDGRSDLFALGAVLYECLTGVPAFRCASSAQTLDCVLHHDAPAPSTVAPGLSKQHDALCRRLLAKNADARFNTALEALDAIRRVQHGSGTTWFRDHRALLGTVALALVAAAAGISYFRGSGGTPLDAVPLPARRWYEQGAEAIREGAYTKGRRALAEAVAQYDPFPLAHARLAEAMSELDEPGPAMSELLKVHELAPNPESLPPTDRLRLAGIRAMVVRDFAKAASSYMELAKLLPGQADVQVDLGRALERLQRRDDAVAAYRKAIALDPDSAVSHLRLGVLLGQSGDPGAMQEFERAHALYQSASNTEGEIETLIARGSWLNGRNRLEAAKQDLELAVRLATDTRLAHQRVRSLLELSSVLASEGRFAEAETMAQNGVEFARTANMDGLAASSLVDFGTVLLAKGRTAEAARLFAQAEEMAQRSGARRTEARAVLSMGSVLVSQGQPREAIPLIERGLAFYKQGGYAQTERIAQTLLASAYAGTGQLERSRAESERLLVTLRAAGDNAAIAVASERLAGVLIDMGRFPEALTAIRESVALNRAAGNQLAMPFVLTREAEVLGRLGRLAEAAKIVTLLQAELDAGHEAFVARAPAIHLARAWIANVMGDWKTAIAAAASASARTAPEQVSVRLSAQLVKALALANVGRRRDAAAEARAAMAGAENAKDARLLLNARGAVPLVFERVRDFAAAHAAAERAIPSVEAIPNPEAAWRLHAVAAVSAAGSKAADAAAHRSAAISHVQALEKAWGPAPFATYANRPDVKQLRTRAGL